MTFSDADARRFAHVVAAIETAGGEIRKAELGEQEAGGLLGDMVNSFVGGSAATTTTFAFVVSDAGIDTDATIEETRAAVDGALDDHPIGEGGDITADGPIPCGWCGGIMADVAEGDQVRYECEDCLAVLRPGPKPVDEEVA